MTFQISLHSLNPLQAHTLPPTSYFKPLRNNSSIAVGMGSREGLFQSPNIPSLCKQTSTALFLCAENSSLQGPRIHISIKQLVTSIRTARKTIVSYCSALQLKRGQDRFNKSLHYVDKRQDSIKKIKLICGKG